MYRESGHARGKEDQEKNEAVPSALFWLLIIAIGSIRAHARIRVQHDVVRSAFRNFQRVVHHRQRERPALTMHGQLFRIQDRHAADRRLLALWADYRRPDAQRERFRIRRRERCCPRG